MMQNKVIMILDVDSMQYKCIDENE